MWVLAVKWAFSLSRGADRTRQSRGVLSRATNQQTHTYTHTRGHTSARSPEGVGQRTEVGRLRRGRPPNRASESRPFPFFLALSACPPGEINRRAACSSFSAGPCSSVRYSRGIRRRRRRRRGVALVFVAVFSFADVKDTACIYTVFDSSCQKNNILNIPF